MLEMLFRRSHHIRRLRANPLGVILDQFVDYLLRRGHKTSVVHQFVRAAEHYGYWLGTCHAAVTAGHVTRASTRQFLHDHLAVCSCPAGFPSSLVSSRTAVNHMVRMLDQQDSARLLPPPTQHGLLLTEYDSFLLQVCGFSEHTRVYRLRNARQFLDRHFGDTPLVPDRLQPSDLQNYFRRHAGHLKPGSVAVLASSLRSFFRFLAVSHGFDPSLPGTVPAAPQWPSSHHGLSSLWPPVLGRPSPLLAAHVPARKAGDPHSGPWRLPPGLRHNHRAFRVGRHARTTAYGRVPDEGGRT
jgi:integrase/recombinase XerD